MVSADRSRRRRGPRDTAHAHSCGSFHLHSSAACSAGYSCAIDFQGLYKSALLARFSGAARRIGFDGKAARERGAAWFYTDRVIPTGQHVAEMNLSLALRAGAQQPSEMRFPIRVPQNEACRVREKLSREGIVDYIVVNPGGGWRSKCWPAERYGELCAEMWNRHGLRAVVNAGPGEEELAGGVVRAAGLAKPFVVQPALPELAAILAQARLVVAADTGPLHLAAALGTHVVGLFGPTDPARNGPLPRGMAMRNVSSEATTYKRGREYSPAMLSLTAGSGGRGRRTRNERHGMSVPREAWARWRVRTGYPIALVCLWLTHPTLGSVLLGSSIALVGLLVRGYAAGHLRKNEALAETGPYARTRNPLYFGSALFAAGFIVSSRSWLAAALADSLFCDFLPDGDAPGRRSSFVRGTAKHSRNMRDACLYFGRVSALAAPRALRGFRSRNIAAIANIRRHLALPRLSWSLVAMAFWRK